MEKLAMIDKMGDVPYTFTNVGRNKKMIYRLIIFMALNFAALAIGGLFTSKGVSSDWYIVIVKAPWTPPGWVFGAAWTSIMICFGIYMAYLWPVIENKNILVSLYAVELNRFAVAI